MPCEKLVREEKRLSSGKARGTFEEMFELAMGFFENPSKLCVSGSHAHRRLVLKGRAEWRRGSPRQIQSFQEVGLYFNSLSPRKSPQLSKYRTAEKCRRMMRV